MVVVSRELHLPLPKHVLTFSIKHEIVGAACLTTSVHKYLIRTPTEDAAINLEAISSM